MTVNKTLFVYSHLPNNCRKSIAQTCLFFKNIIDSVVMSVAGARIDLLDLSVTFYVFCLFHCYFFMH